MGLIGKLGGSLVQGALGNMNEIPVEDLTENARRFHLSV